MGKALAWLRRHPGVFVLIVAVIAGQVLQHVLQPSMQEFYPVGELPVLPLVALAVALLLAVVIIWCRVAFGHDLVRVVKTSSLALPASESLPKRYVVADPPGQLVSGSLALLDVILLLLVQATFRGPILAIASGYLTRSTAEIAFVIGVVLLTLILLAKLYRHGGPVLMLTLWWGLDRIVPTAGFLAAPPEVLPARPRTLTHAAVTPQGLPTPRVAEPTPAEPTAVAPVAASLEPTVVAANGGTPQHEPVTAAPVAAEAPPEPEATVVAPQASQASPEATVVAPQESQASLEATVVQDATVISKRTRPDETS